MAVTAALLVFAGSLDHGVAKTRDACRDTARMAARACEGSARSDKLLALGICDNVADASAARTCADQAASDAKDAHQSCEDQRKARQAACQRLGAAAYDPPIDPANFGGPIDNPFFPLVPGTTFVYEGPTPDGFEHEEFVVTHETRTILGVVCTTVHDSSTINGVLAEDTRDYFAQDKQGNVWYFGENSLELAGGLVVSTEGSWTGGVDGAKPGIIMEAHPAKGDFYRQEFLLGTAEDLAENVATVTTPGSIPNTVPAVMTATSHPATSFASVHDHPCRRGARRRSGRHRRPGRPRPRRRLRRRWGRGHGARHSARGSFHGAGGSMRDGRFDRSSARSMSHSNRGAGCNAT